MIFLSSAIILISIILDQITKIAADKFLLDSSVNFIPNILSFSHVKNPGAAFGILSDNRWVFMIFSSVAIIVMIYLMFKSKSNSRLFYISISMLVGGGIGNMIDRIFRGYVVDFLKVEFIDFPVFNIADCFVTVGAILLAIYLFFFYDDSESSTTPHAKKTTEIKNDILTNNEESSNISPDEINEAKEKTLNESE